MLAPRRDWPDQRPRAGAGASTVGIVGTVGEAGEVDIRALSAAGTELATLQRRGVTSKSILVIDYYRRVVADWSFLTNHARALLLVTRVPDARLKDVAAALGVTERTAYGIVADLTDAGYVVKVKDGRRNRYHVQAHLPLRDSVSRARPIGDVLELLVGADPGGPSPARSG